MAGLWCLSLSPSIVRQRWLGGGVSLSLSLSLFLDEVRVAGWWYLSLSPSIVKLKVAGLWSLFLSVSFRFGLPLKQESHAKLISRPSLPSLRHKESLSFTLSRGERER